MRIAYRVAGACVVAFSAARCGGNVVVDPSSAATSGAGGAGHASSVVAGSTGGAGGMGGFAPFTDAASVTVVGSTTGVGGGVPFTGATSSSSSGSCLPSVPDEHRPASVTCTPSMPQMPCMTDAQCVEGDGLGGIIQGKCTSANVCDFNQCATDADCSAGDVCNCQSSSSIVSECVPAGCHVDADCGAAGYCSPSGTVCHGNIDFECHTCMDQCVNDSDCTNPQASVCAFDPALGFWACSAITVCAG